VVQLSNIPDYLSAKTDLIYWIDENINVNIPNVHELSTDVEK